MPRRQPVLTAAIERVSAAVRPAAGAPADGSSEAEPSPRTNCANRARDSAIEGTHRYGFPQPPLKVISNRPSPRATLVIVKAGVVSDGTGPAVCRLVSGRTRIL